MSFRDIGYGGNWLQGTTLVSMNILVSLVSGYKGQFREKLENGIGCYSP